MYRKDHPSPRSAFTLIELLVVIAIISILAVVVVLTLNPAQLLAQSRDSSRLSDMATLNSALGIYAEDGGLSLSLGSASTTYVSIPDPTATSIAGDQCQGLVLPALGTSYSYYCAESSPNRNVDSTGWIPVNFKNISSGSPIANLPIDPLNQTSGNFYYTYTTNGTQYEITSIVESQKYRTQFGTTYPIQSYPGVNAQGSSLMLSELYNPTGLVGYWNFNEGSGTMAYDTSGGGNNGTWRGTAPYYTGGKVGSYAGNFNGTDEEIIVTSSPALSPASLSIAVWVKTITTGEHVIVSNLYPPGFPAGYWLGEEGTVLFACLGAPGGQQCEGSTPNFYDGRWHFLVFTYNNGTGLWTWYMDGISVGTYNQFVPIGVSPVNFQIGLGNWSTTNYWTGSLDDIRIYNRALSAAEVWAIYNTQH